MLPSTVDLFVLCRVRLLDPRSRPELVLLVPENRSFHACMALTFFSLRCLRELSLEEDLGLLGSCFLEPPPPPSGLGGTVGGSGVGSWASSS